MSTELVNPEALTKPIGYAHAVIGTGRAVTLAGQIGCGLDGRIEAPGDLVAQFKKTLDNLMIALRACGGVAEDLAFLRIYTTDVPGYRAAARELGAAYRERIGKHFPAMALLGVTELYEPGSVIEIEGLAYID